MSRLEIAPFISLNTELVEGRLRVWCPASLDWLTENLTADLATTTGLRHPWLQRVDGGAAWASYALPPAGGVTLGALWRSLNLDAQARVSIGFLKTMMRAWPVSMFPRSGVLCDTQGVLWLAPPFPRCVEGAAKTWNDWQFDEYCIGGVTSEVTQSLAFTLTRLLVQAPLTSMFSMRAAPPALPSTKLAWLQPLDALVTEAFDELAAKREPAPAAAARWASTLAVLEDQSQQSSPLDLGALVASAWPGVEAHHRWPSDS